MKRQNDGSWWLAHLFVFACFAPAIVVRAADAPPAKNVLILYSFTAREALQEFGPVEETLRSHFAGPVNFDVEYLDALRFDAPGYERALADSLAATYREKKIDLVLTAFYPALHFAVQNRAQVFPGAPIVFFSVMPKRLEGQKLWPGVTGVTYTGDMKATFDVARRLQPETRNVAVIAGGSAFERYLAGLGIQDLQAREPGLQAINLVGLPADQLLARVDALPPHTVAYFLMIPEDSARPVTGTYNILNAIAQKLPTYCVQSYCMGHGTIGGSYADFAEQGIKAGEIGTRVLSGETPENIPVAAGSAATVHVDAQQLSRWKIPQSALPAGAILLNPEPRLLQRLRLTILEWTLLAAVILISTLLLGEFVLHSLQRRKDGLRLREGEGRFQVIADAMPFLIWTTDKNGEITYINKSGTQFTNGTSPADLSQSWIQSIHTDDLEGYLSAVSFAIQKKSGFSQQYRLLRRDGEYRWMLDIAAPRTDEGGLFLGLIGSASDVTDQKLAQEALRGIGGRLIEAQEKERSRIARELHDDICQKLALLSMELEMSKRMVLRPGGPVEVRIEEIRQHCSGIAADVQALSHELHSSRLDYLGLTVALESFCREFSQQQNVNVDFKCDRIPGALPKAVALSLFRIAQEGLHNSLKYSGVDRFSLRLWGSGDSIHLEIGDTGAGFDVELARGSKGLGLISMQERAHLVGGSFAIESRVGFGTRIMVSVPITGDRSHEPSGSPRNHVASPSAEFNLQTKN